jgi:uncharacterized protein DUF3551
MTMKHSRKFSLSAAALFTFAFVVAAPVARADDYCITNGAQAAHGCGYPSMETCRAAAAGIGGMCSQSASSSSSKSPSDAMAKAHPRRSKPHKNQSTGS